VLINYVVIITIINNETSPNLGWRMKDEGQGQFSLKISLGVYLNFVHLHTGGGLEVVGKGYT